GRWLPGGVAPRRGDSEGASQDRPTTKDDTTPDGGPRNGPSAEPRNRPTAAVVVDAAAPELVAALDDVLPGLLPADWSGRGMAAALAALEVRRLSIVDVVELVSGVGRPAAWWHRLSAARQHADGDALAGLPVPLADGRVVTGPRGLLLPAGGLPAAGLDALGLRVVHPEAAHPLLERLGAVPATAAGVLA